MRERKAQDGFTQDGTKVSEYFGFESIILRIGDSQIIRFT